MFFPDRTSGYREARAGPEARRAFFYSAYGIASRRTILRTMVTKALAKMFPDDPPRFMARTPHGYHDTALDP